MDERYILDTRVPFKLIGIGSVDIEYDEAGHQWRARRLGKVVLAACNASKTSLMMGTHRWTVYNDSVNWGGNL